MSNALADARALLVSALEPVMPGRVGAYPPGSLVTPPYVWVDVSTGRPERSGTASTMWVATFPVWVAVDGDDRAQIALLDDLTARLVDACEATRGLQARQWVPRELPDRPRVRVAVIDVAVTITARTLCPPNVSAVLVPPEPVEVT
jgi:hypothetical protein